MNKMDERTLISQKIKKWEDKKCLFYTLTQPWFY